MIRLTLELDPGPGTIRGSVTPEGSEPQDFFGWIDLAALLDHLRETGPVSAREEDL